MEIFGIQLSETLSVALDAMALIFILSTGLTVLALVVTYIIDITQSKHTIRRNYPIIGHFRYFFENLGTFFRQYFFAMDREELPFNRAERSWVYRASKGLEKTIAFGSTKDLRPSGSIFFVNCPFPALEKEATTIQTLTIGPYCDKPYETDSLFNISGMSYGAISKPAVLALSNGARMAGCWMNTGEGGLAPYHLEGGADIVCQIGTAKFGVRDAEGNLSDEKLRKAAAHSEVKMFELKLSQGAKPGEGGIVPAAKVTPEIAEIRGIPPYQAAISPNRHTDIETVDNLLDVIGRIRKVTGKPVGIKMVVGISWWLDELFNTINERGIESAPDFITVDGSEGGSGAAPMSLMDNMGLPLRESLPLIIDKLNKFKLRQRVKVVASGKLITPSDVARALCIGADFITSARGFMFSLGCIQALQCNKDTCPTGITTHNARLQKGLDPKLKAVRVMNYVNNMVHEVGVIAHACGVKEPRNLRRFHARIVTENGNSIPLNKIYPDYGDGDEYTAKPELRTIK